MIRTVEAIIDSHGYVRLLEVVHVTTTRRALVTILDDESAAGVSETALLSERALAKDWSRPEEERAWSHLQQAQ